MKMYHVKVAAMYFVTIGSIVLTLVLIFGMASSSKSDKKTDIDTPQQTTECEAWNNPPAPKTIICSSKYEIVSISYEWEYDSLYIIGEIKNNGDTPGSPKLEAIARDKNGTLVDSDQFWPNSTVNIQPGSSCGIKFPITKNRNATKVEVKVISENIF